jgi:hypothetical protein
MTIRLFAVAAWRQALPFTGDERAALELAEAVTRLSDRADPVPDAIWDEAARHYDEPALHDLRHDLAHHAGDAGWSLEEAAYYLGYGTKKGTPVGQTTVRYT